MRSKSRQLFLRTEIETPVRPLPALCDNYEDMNTLIAVLRKLRNTVASEHYHECDLSLTESHTQSIAWPLSAMLPEAQLSWEPTTYACLHRINRASLNHFRLADRHS